MKVTLKDFIGVPIMWKTEYTDGTKVNDVFVGVKIEGDILYDSEDDRWVDLEYATKNLIK